MFLRCEFPTQFRHHGSHLVISVVHLVSVRFGFLDGVDHHSATLIYLAGWQIALKIFSVKYSRRNYRLAHGNLGHDEFNTKCTFKEQAKQYI